jgi:hypothetical protein
MTDSLHQKRRTSRLQLPLTYSFISVSDIFPTESGTFATFLIKNYIFNNKQVKHTDTLAHISPTF